MKNNQLIAAAGLLFTMHASAQNSIYSGSGFGTYYYDVQNDNQCGTDFSDANLGQVECSLTQAWTLKNVNSDYLVAMNHTQLVEDMGSYCGKQVIVSVNGVASNLPLFIGDGCERCATGPSSATTWNPSGAPGLDFSYTVANELSSQACNDGHIEITWEIVDNTIYNFDYAGTGAAQGFASGGSGGSGGSGATSSSKPPTSPAPSSSSSSSRSQATTFATATSTAAPSTPSNKENKGNSASTSPCSDNAWQCTADGTSLEQCIGTTWTIREVCSSGLVCKGGSNPYCIQSS